MKGWDSNVSRGTTGDLAWDSQVNPALKYLDEQFARGKLSRDEMKAFGAQHKIKPLSLADVREYLSFRDAHKTQNMDSRKRPRAESFNSLAAKKAYWAQKRFGSVAPWSTHGAIRVKRGTAGNLSAFGPSWAKANKTQRAARKAYGYTGRGRYGIFRKAYRLASNPRFQRGFKRGVGLGADALSLAAIANPELLPAAAVGEGVSKYLGRGAYRSANGLIKGSKSTMPRMRNIKDETGTLVVTHRERLMDVFAPNDSGFHQDTFIVSPGIEKTFPWLSQIAANYEEYELVQCVFEYDGHSLVGINDTLEVQGSLIMATQMNVKDKPFRDRHEMERFPHASKCAQHGSMAHGVECDPRKISGDGHKYIRLGGLAKDEDVRDYDHAKFTIGQYNTPTELYGKEIGQLFVYYTVKLIKPKISSGRGDAISTFRAFCEAPVSTRAFGRLGDDVAQDAGNGMQVAARNTLPMTPSYDTANDLVMTFDPYVSGTFRVTVTLKLNGALTTPLTVVAGGSASLVKSQLPFANASYVMFQSTSSDAILVADVQVRPRDLASSSLASFRIDGLHTEDLLQSSIEVTEINILEENSATDQPELKLIA